MKYAKVCKTNDVSYKGGFIKCKCGWTNSLGDGFNEYFIKYCPDCTPKLETYDKRKVITGTRNNYKATVGDFIYFVLTNGIHAQYSASVHFERFGLSEKQADAA